MPSKRPPTRRSSRGLRGYFHRANLLTSLVLIFPLFIFYQLGVALDRNDVGNGADLISGRIISLLGASKTNYLLFNLGLVVVFAIALGVMRKRQQFDVRLFLPVLLESAVYALGMGTVITYVMSLIHINPSLIVGTAAATSAHAQPGSGSLLTRVALSLGAGVNEELLFRLAMIPLFTWVGAQLMGMRRGLAVGIAFVLSSVIFSAAHHVIGGEPWAMGKFTYRFFCGLIFASLFQFRGLAVAVYTHALYDIYVMVFQSA